MKRLSILLLFCLTSLVASCGSDEFPKGAVALVNGKPVYLTDVEFAYDLRHMDSGEEDNPTVERLRDEHGQIVAGLIVRELIFQELTKAGDPVSDAEMKDAEDKVRADYPGEAFDQMLVEENIDLGQWREAVRARLAAEKFLRRLSKDKIKIEIQEAADYYKDHRSDFTYPEKVSFILIQGPDSTTVKAALEKLGEHPEQNAPGEYLQLADGVSVQHPVLRPEALPQPWAKALEKLKPGQASAPLADGGQTRIMVLTERIPPKTLDAAQAYPLVEERIKEAKLRRAFTDWLENAMSTSAIKVSARLMPSASQAAQSGQGPAMDDFGSRLPLSTEGQINPAANDQVRKTVEQKLRETDPEARQSAQEESPIAHDAETAIKTADQQTAELPETETAGENASSGPDQTPQEEMKASGEGDKGATESSSTSSEETKAQETPQAEASPVSGDAGPKVEPSPANQDEKAAAPLESVSGDQKEPVQEAQAQAGETGKKEKAGPGEVTFTANKASWIIFTADDGKEERIYVKGGKSLTVPFKQALKVRFGSPSDVTYSYNGQETLVISSAKEVKTADFP